MQNHKSMNKKFERLIKDKAEDISQQVKQKIKWKTKKKKIKDFKITNSTPSKSNIQLM